MAAPLTLDQKIWAARMAAAFFAPNLPPDMRATFGLEPMQPGETIRPLSVLDFIQSVPRWMPASNGWDHTNELLGIISALQRSNMLSHAGSTGSPMFGDCYYSMTGVPAAQRGGDFWLAPMLGPEVIVEAARAPLVHLLGMTKDGDEHGGTGLLVSTTHILTAKHVVDGMKLHDEQTLGAPPGQEPPTATVVELLTHEKHDLALVVVDPGGFSVTPVVGLPLREPTWTDPVLLMGYPIVPRAGETPLTVQKGEVVNPLIRTYHDEDLFLYSAIARPGNSGGPIIGLDGRLVGLVTEELFDKPDEQSERAPASPFYAGLPASVISSGLADLGHPDLLAFDS